jgi:hypothetical protein
MEDPISLMVAIAGFCFIIYSLASLAKRRMRFSTVLGWLSIGASMVIVGIFPFEISQFLLKLGVTAPFNALVIFYFLILTAILLLIYKRLLGLEDKLVKVVQNEGLRHFKEENKEELKE